MAEKSNADSPVDPRQLFILSGPSGVGKNSIAAELCRRSLASRAVTATTRPPKPGEADGKDYHFIGKDEFERWIQQRQLVEHTEYLGHYYGTPFFCLASAAASELPVVLTIDVDGGLQVKSKWPEATLIFVRPPSEAELRRRLDERRRDDSDSVEQRLQRAHEEYAYADKYDFCVVNDDLSKAVEEVARIISLRRTSQEDSP